MENDASQVATTQPYALGRAPQSDDFWARRERLVRNRTAPDTRRRAFLQELAIAVADELELRQGLDEVIANEYATADNAQCVAQEAVKRAQHDAAHPLELAFRTATGYKPSRWENLTGPVVARKTLDWAIKEGILAPGTTEMPSVEAQYLALAQPSYSVSGSEPRPLA